MTVKTASLTVTKLPQSPRIHALGRGLGLGELTFSSTMLCPVKTTSVTLSLESGGATHLGSL